MTWNKKDWVQSAYNKAIGQITNQDPNPRVIGEHLTYRIEFIDEDGGRYISYLREDAMIPATKPAARKKQKAEVEVVEEVKAVPTITQHDLFKRTA